MVKPQNVIEIRERGTSYCLIRSPFRPQNFLNDDFKRSLTYSFSGSLLEIHITLIIKYPYEEQAVAYRISCEIKRHRRRRWNIATQVRKVCDMEIEIITFDINV